MEEEGGEERRQPWEEKRKPDQGHGDRDRNSEADWSAFCDVQVISSDGAYALSASWDKTLRLWELATGTTTRRFVGHTNDVLSVSFSADNRQIVSGSRDRTIKLWNTLGDCKYTITDKGHSEWVSCVRFSPNPQNPVIVSSSWDKLVKVCLGSHPLVPSAAAQQTNAPSYDVLQPKYLLLQSSLRRAMRQLNTIALMNQKKNTPLRLPPLSAVLEDAYG